MITALPVEVGQVVSAGQLIVRVARLDELEAVVSIPESRIDADRKAMATVTLWADDGRVYEAKLREVSPQADPATRTYQARYSLPKPDAAITLGKTATVHLASQSAGERATLPLAAVFKDQGQPSVWLIDEAHGRLIKQGVEVSCLDRNVCHHFRRPYGRPEDRGGGRSQARRRYSRPHHRGGAMTTPAEPEHPVSRGNLSAWAVQHPALVLFLIIVFSVAGLMSYLNLGRAEDPSFAIKTMVISAAWPGATAEEMQDQVADKLEKRLQELELFDYVKTYTRPGVTVIQVQLKDTARQKEVDDAWYQVRKKLNDSRPTLPQGVQGPFFNDEYGDVYSAIYMLSGSDVSLAKLKDYAEIVRQRLLRTEGVAKVDIVGVREQRIFIEFSHRKLATLGITPQAIFDSVARQNAVTPAGTVETSADRIDVRVTGAFKGEAAIAEVPIEAGGRHLPARRYCHRQARLRGPAEQHRAPQRQRRRRRRRRHDQGRQRSGAGQEAQGRDCRCQDAGSDRRRDRPDHGSAARRRGVGERVPALVRRGARHRARRQLHLARMALRPRRRDVRAARAGGRASSS